MGEVSAPHHLQTMRSSNPCLSGAITPAAYAQAPNSVFVQLRPGPPCRHTPPPHIYLVEDEGLADVAPGGSGRAEVDEAQQKQHQAQASRGGRGADEEHHNQAREDPQEAGVPREDLEGGAAGRAEGGTLSSLWPPQSWLQLHFTVMLSTTL